MDLTVLFQIEVQIWSRAQFQNCTETVVVDLDGVVLLHYSSMVQVFVDLVLSDRMLYVVVLNLFAPRVVKMMDFACHFSAVFEIVSFINFGIPAFSEDA